MDYGYIPLEVCAKVAGQIGANSKAALIALGVSAFILYIGMFIIAYRAQRLNKFIKFKNLELEYHKWEIESRKYK